MYDDQMYTKNSLLHFYLFYIRIAESAVQVYT